MNWRRRDVGGELGACRVSGRGAASLLARTRLSVATLKTRNLASGEKLKRIEGFQLVLRGEAIRNVERVLCPVVGKVLLRPRIRS